MFAKVPNFREPQFINWKFIFKILVDPVGNYARQLAECEREDLNTLSEWVKDTNSNFRRSMNTKA